VYYGNGFAMRYEILGSGIGKMLWTHDLKNGVYYKNAEKLFKYFDENISDAKKAESYLISKGWKYGGYGDKSCNSDGEKLLWIRAGKCGLEWRFTHSGNRYIVLVNINAGF
jgi:hypothetical protein